MQRIVFCACLMIIANSAAALDAECDPLVKASEARISQSAWHTVTEGDELTLEAMKVAGKFFMQMDGSWQAMPMNLDNAEKIAIGQMQDGSIKVTECKMLDSVVLDGRALDVFSYKAEIVGSGMPASTSTLYIGKDDGLPYKLTDSDGGTQVTHRYEGVTAPAL